MGEMRARQGFEMPPMDMKNQIEQATGGRTEKSEAKAKALRAAADKSRGRPGLHHPLGNHHRNAHRHQCHGERRLLPGEATAVGP